MQSITVPVPVCDEQIEGYLAPADRDKTGAIKVAIESFLSHSARAYAANRRSSTVQKTPATQGRIEGPGRGAANRTDSGQRGR